MALLFGFGALAGDGTKAIAETIRIILIALPFMALFQALSTALNASHRTGHVLRYSAIALALALMLYASLRVLDFPISLAASTGFVSFSVFASCLGLYSVFGARDTLRTLRSLCIIALRTCLIALPFTWLWPSTRDGNLAVMDFATLSILGLALLAVNFPVFKELAGIRDDRREPR